LRTFDGRTIAAAGGGAVEIGICGAQRDALDDPQTRAIKLGAPAVRLAADSPTIPS
jgi:hypothetical protein